MAVFCHRTLSDVPPRVINITVQYVTSWIMSHRASHHTLPSVTPCDTSHHAIRYNTRYVTRRETSHCAKRHPVRYTETDYTERTSFCCSKHWVLTRIFKRPKAQQDFWEFWESCSLIGGTPTGRHSPTGEDSYKSPFAHWGGLVQVAIRPLGRTRTSRHSPTGEDTRTAASEISCGTESDSGQVFSGLCAIGN